MFLFGLGRLVYVAVLITNAIAILSEDRFLARIGWGRSQADPAFGTSYDSTSVKAKTVDLIASVRTVMRSMLSMSYLSSDLAGCLGGLCLRIWAREHLYIHFLDWVLMTCLRASTPYRH
ncbi:Yos1-like-domain-containing protein [Aspergillus transmontanensis]|uniref:Yos1-like-domain-containing protein n=1 Tax=Aspergillus transmontanensis TaxID=1034304 RepID=A0A5N6W2R0_9EURO|nr:Yos1-like-domain-containing protein [Aspergillus transmontanensis]